MYDLERDYPENVFLMMGLHPTYVKDNYLEELQHVETELAKRKFVAIGEIGIDLYWDKSFLAQQQEALQIQTDWAIKFRLPLVLHTRDSFSETYELVSRKQHENLTGVFHCFSGTAEEAKKAIELNFYLGIGGVATFKNGGLDKVLPEIPLERLVLETDCPYLSPEPVRKIQRNEPAHVRHTAACLAEVRATTLEAFAEQTSANAKRLFRV